MMNVYDILDIPVDADQKTIALAFHTKSLIMHDDKNLERKEVATREYQILLKAYNLISTPDARMQYDIEHLYTHLPPGHKKMMIQQLKKLDDAVSKFIKSLPAHTGSDARKNLLEEYKATLQNTMKAIYIEHNPSKLYKLFENLMQQTKTAAAHCIIADDPKSCKFFTKIIHAINNCSHILSSSNKSPPVIHRFHQMKKMYHSEVQKKQEPGPSHDLIKPQHK